MNRPEKKMLLSSIWLQVAILTFLVGFGVLGYLAVRVNKEAVNLLLVRIFEWFRLPGDALFIGGGIIPVVYLAVRMFLNRERPGVAESIGEERFTERV